jgi:LAGLIDADG DNA endonuclease family protein
MRNNASRADNQQERLEKIPPANASYISGFVDGEGSFNVALIPRSEYRFGWKIYLTFNVAQKDPTMLNLIRNYFGAGRLEQRRDGVWNYSVNDIHSLQKLVIPFFEMYSFLSESKQKNFKIFKEIVEVIGAHGHFTKDGLEKVVILREILNEGKGRKRKYSLADYKASRESSETIRRIRHGSKDASGMI